MLDFRVWYSNPWVLVNLVHAYWDYARKGNIKQYTVHESATLWLAELGAAKLINCTENLPEVMNYKATGKTSTNISVVLIILATSEGPIDGLQWLDFSVPIMICAPVVHVIIPLECRK